MGMDLKLLPYYVNFDNRAAFSHEIIMVNRDSDLFDRINNIPQQEVEPDFTSYLSYDDQYEEAHYGLSVKDAYGDNLKFCRAGDLKKCDIGGAAGAYVNALVDNHKIALFWH